MSENTDVVSRLKQAFDAGANRHMPLGTLAEAIAIIEASRQLLESTNKMDSATVTVQLDKANALRDALNVASYGPVTSLRRRDEGGHVSASLDMHRMRELCERIGYEFQVNTGPDNMQVWLVNSEWGGGTEAFSTEHEAVRGAFYGYAGPGLDLYGDKLFKYMEEAAERRENERAGMKP